MKITVILLAGLALGLPAKAQEASASSPPDRWRIAPDGSIEWRIDNRVPHSDHIEMSGEQVSMWVQYGVDSLRTPHTSAVMVFPAFRLRPNKTASSMMYMVGDEDLPAFFLNNQPLRADIINGVLTNGLPETTERIRFNGILEIDSRIGKDGGLLLRRYLFPSAKAAMALEKLVFINQTRQSFHISTEYMNKEVRPSAATAIDGPLRFIVSGTGDGDRVVPPGDSVVFGCSFRAVKGEEEAPPVDLDAEWQGRQKRVQDLMFPLQLETPDTLLNTAFSFAKLRAAESIFKTKNGYVHSPGGLRYYAAIWANDQAEYAGPFFAFLGDSLAGRAAMTAYRWFARYMNPEYQPIPSSIIAEGEGTWHGRGDRGDMAMIAYGAGRYALACGQPDSARALWPLIEWCLEYLRRQVNQNGVVHSNSDELEGRFPSGDANLNTSCLYYDALVSAALLGKELGKPGTQTYVKEAGELRTRIGQFFGARVEGFDTYRYYEGDSVLRAWIATPLTMGILDRAPGTIQALFSSRLWTKDGLATQAGDRTFWDRSTLYALRGVLEAGENARGMDYLEYYTRRRLLGEHVPYPVEAYPEGNQRHLSAESALYCRIYTEGLFGIRPSGLTSFLCTPRLPSAWDHMALRRVYAFGHHFDLEVTRKEPGKLEIKVREEGKEKAYNLPEGGTQRVRL